MKKILSILAVVSMSTSTICVTSCSTINLKKKSIKNQISNLTQISSTLLRGSIIQNASQEINKGFAYDSNYLNNLVYNSKANELIPLFDTNSETTLNSLRNLYFDNQNLDRNAINDLNKDFLSDKVKSPTSSIQSIASIAVFAITTLKSNGGIHPSLSGLIQGAIPKLGLNDNLADNLNSEKLKPIANLIKNIKDPLAKTIGFLQESNAIYAILKNFFNSEFENAIKEKDMKAIFDWIIKFLNDINLSGGAKIFDDLVNSLLLQEKDADELTGQMIINASLNKINNIFARIINQENKIITGENLFSLSKNFDKDLGKIIGEFLKQITKENSNLNIQEVLKSIFEKTENISDILFVFSSLLKYISSIDFSSFIPLSNEYLFDSKKLNNDYLAELNKLTLKDNPYNTARLLKNLSTITNIENNLDGKQMQKLFYLLFNSGEKVTNIDQNIGLISLIPKISSPWIGQNKKNNYSSLLYGIGNGIAIWKDWSFAGIGPDQVGNVLRWVIGDGLGFNSNFSGLNKVIEILNSIGINIDLKVSEKTTSQLNHLFSAIWDEDSTLIKDLTGQQISLYSLFKNEIVEGITLSKLIDLIYKALTQVDPTSTMKKSKNIDKKAEGLSKGLDIISKEMVNDKYQLWYQSNNNEKQFKQNSENGNYNALQALILTSTRNGLYLKINEDPIIVNQKVRGPKASMYALGTDFDTNGNQIFSKFRNSSIMQGLEYIFDDEITNQILDDLLKAFNEINSINTNISNNIYKKLIKSQNFKTKILNYKNIDQNNLEQSITYEIVYNEPFTNKTFKYQIDLILKLDQSSWKINSIKRV
ncbi:hypothetical protein [Spiroplasma cantharicola]|uniref:MOLPALP family lipoprotein n=1 Tax=Spiroplasma cantharicola TaxID=362837 RepID=A0A0M4JI70_9MOLU|nr:hypothetical protein [Spiroplasma cantharicola]ALD66241.1 hypothetical protein SCANT_v1c03310 [Spiroplasma cantharicola]